MPNLIPICRRLSQRVEALRFSEPVTYIYNPLRYARVAHEIYCKKYGSSKKKTLWLGMNPGPFGMAQTGVPFGEIEAVRDWLGIEANVEAPEHQHPKRPIEGFACTRSEVSGRRLWGWAKERFGEASRFFADNFVYNYCPLVFVAQSGRNITPDKIPAAETAALYEACDEALRNTALELGVERVIGVGAFAETRARRALAGEIEYFFRVPHPSPASPVANRGWDAAIEASLAKQKIQL